MKLRRAKLSDVETMMSLINGYAEKGLMLARSRNILYETIREFLLMEEENKIIAVGSLHILWDDLAEIRALAVAEDYIGRGVGTKLVNSLIEEARELGCPQVFALTYQPEFFKKCGFTLINKEDMPHKVWKECIHCVKFPNCDENAMILSLE
ncbi:MAG: N-acetyltransferase [Desulfitobacterium hafniense]|nr:N-acetyltransferase [Desulfitobacterium hafniense]